MTATLPSLSNLQPNPAWASLPLFDRAGRKNVRFGEVVKKRRVLDKLLNNSKALHNRLTQSRLDILCLYNSENIAIW
jgi:hypothetical protein